MFGERLGRSRTVRVLAIDVKPAHASGVHVVARETLAFFGCWSNRARYSVREKGGAVKRRKRPKVDQLTFDRYQRGGTRPGAGRKKSKDSGVSHAKREALDRHHPVHG